MPTLSKQQATERLAAMVEKAKPSALVEFYSELFPDKPTDALPSAFDLANGIRNGLEAEEIVDLWNVVFPAHRNVWFDEQTNELHYNEQLVSAIDAD